MPYSVQAKNAMLDALGALAVYQSVHKLNPGSTGASELAGSTRQAVTWAAASGGSKTQSNSPTFSGLSTSDPVAYIGLYTALTGGTWLGYQQVTSTLVTGGPTWAYTVNPGTMDLNQLASA